jgi:hypothetical protein
MENAVTQSLPVVWLLGMPTNELPEPLRELEAERCCSIRRSERSNDSSRSMRSTTAARKIASSLYTGITIEIDGAGLDSCKARHSFTRERLRQAKVQSIACAAWSSTRSGPRLAGRAAV